MTSNISKQQVNDELWMRKAIEYAIKAQETGEVPVGAIIVKDNTIIGTGYNRPIQTNDPTSHAEIMAIRDAANNLNNYRIPGTTLFVTLEPCSMCVGAMIHSRIKRLVFGASDPKTGAVGGVSNLLDINQHKHHIEFTSGILKYQCGEILKSFFKLRRNNSKSR